ncbi:MAG: hypothetical protein JETT_0010 [Candidatus Jettenia ecosi]|uniref:Uncharacterized protein n=1 Tax=Candidatus Jettenia ecosi TaxID=2494326 RepID=A0A533QFZ4_9BACT|nr:MAG: hypothetical protein JETT_0010 [Candidatus Jettenia ecosi]
MKELEKALMNALSAISCNKEIIQPLVGFHWTIFYRMMAIWYQRILWSIFFHKLFHYSSEYVF